MSNKQELDLNVPPEFYKIMKDFLSDLLVTFPEYEESITEQENIPIN